MKRSILAVKSLATIVDLAVIIAMIVAASELWRPVDEALMIEWIVIMFSVIAYFGIWLNQPNAGVLVIKSVLLTVFALIGIGLIVGLATGLERGIILSSEAPFGFTAFAIGGLIINGLNMAAVAWGRRKLWYSEFSEQRRTHAAGSAGAVGLLRY